MVAGAVQFAWVMRLELPNVQKVNRANPRSFHFAVPVSLSEPATLLNAIYEEDFLGFSYGFRPGRGTHDRIATLVAGSPQ